MVAVAMDGNDDQVLAEHVLLASPSGHFTVLVAGGRLGELAVKVRWEEVAAWPRGFDRALVAPLEKLQEVVDHRVVELSSRSERSHV